MLETTFTTDGGTIRVIDSLNQSPGGLLPWAEPARDIRPARGEVPMRWRVAPGTLFHRARPWARLWDVPVLHAGDLMIAIVTERTGEPCPGPGEFTGEFIARAGQGALLALDSFINLGLTQEVQGTLAWMLRCISATAPVIHPFYGLRGHVPDEEVSLRMRGYRDSCPARGGNQATDQPQWGSYGDLLE